MPISLDPRAVDHYAHVPLYRQLADVLRAAMDDGRLAAGETLPSEAEIGEATGLSRTAVRAGMDVLVAEGRVVKASGRPTRVARQAPVRRMGSDRYADELRRLAEAKRTGKPLAGSAFSRDYGVDWSGVSYDVTYSQDPATSRDVEQLGLKLGEPVLRRHFVKHVNGHAVQIQDSVMPMALVEGTPIADPTRQPWPGGTIAELWSLDLVVTRVIEDVRARLPRDDERRDLGMEAIGPVWEITRRFFVGDRPVEASEVVISSARNVLCYETDLSGVLDEAAAESARRAASQE
jgi:GntR family transcriptional regulator